MTFDVRISAKSGSVNGTTFNESVETHDSIRSIFDRVESYVGRLGYDGHLKQLILVIEIPEMEALKAAREDVNRRIGELEAQKY